MLNVGMVASLEFWQTIFEFQGLKHLFLSRVSLRQGRLTKSRVVTFFCINKRLCLFSFQGKLIRLKMDIHVQPLPSLCRKLKIIRTRQILTALFLKFTKCGKKFKCYCWTLHMFIHSYKKIKERRQISTVNDVFCYSLNTDNLG